MNKSDSIASLAAALAVAQSEMSNPVFDAVNPHFKNKYASLSAVRDAVTPVLSKHGLSVTQLFHACEKVGFVAIETVLIHSSGEWISSLLEMPSEKPNAQGYGSAATYAKRYGLMAITGVVGDDDDDANHAVGNPAQPMPIGKTVTKSNAASQPPRQQVSLPPKKEEPPVKKEAPSSAPKEEKSESVVCPACGTPGMIPPKGNNPYYRCYEKACEKKIHKDDWGKTQVDKSPEPPSQPIERQEEVPQEFSDADDPNVPF